MVAASRVAVIGGSGFIGSRVVELLSAAGAAVTSVGRPGGQTLALPGVQHVEVDLLDRPDLASALSHAELVVHLAALSGGIQFQAGQQAPIYFANHAMTRAVVEAASRAGARRIFFASSGVVYRAGGAQSLPESAPLIDPSDPQLSAYAWSKLSDEAVATWVNRPPSLETVVGRLTNVYGAGGSFDPARSTVVHSLVAKAVEAAPDGVLAVWGDGSAVRSFIHADDAARAILAILQRGAAGGCYNIDASTPITIRELAGMVRDAVDPRIQMRFEPDKPRGAPHRVLDGAKLRALGFEPRISLEDGVRETVKAYRDSRDASA